MGSTGRNKKPKNSIEKPDTSAENGQFYWVATKYLTDFFGEIDPAVNYSDFAGETNPKLSGKTVAGILKGERCTLKSAKAIVAACRKFGYVGKFEDNKFFIMI